MEAEPFRLVPAVLHLVDVAHRRATDAARVWGYRCFRSEPYFFRASVFLDGRCLGVREWECVACHLFFSFGASCGRYPLQEHVVQRSRPVGCPESLQSGNRTCSGNLGARTELRMVGFGLQCRWHFHRPVPSVGHESVSSCTYAEVREREWF